jgi:hypothetical protein
MPHKSIRASQRVHTASLFTLRMKVLSFLAVASILTTSVGFVSFHSRRFVPGFNVATVSESSPIFASSLINVFDNSESTIDLTPKSITKEVMAYFSKIRSQEELEKFQSYINNESVISMMDGMHIITLLFQAARKRIKIGDVVPINFILDKLQGWGKEWNERDISMFMYGMRALKGVGKEEGELLKFAATKISESKAVMNGRAIGNALYGFQDITSATDGVPELCDAFAEKLKASNGDMSGQDIGIAMYGLQGMRAEKVEVRKLILALSELIAASEVDFDAQAMSNSLYGLQSMSSEHSEVCSLITALANKVAESKPILKAQAIGSALYGLQNLDSDALEVRTLLAALVEKVELATESLDAQAIGNALFGLQRMKSNSPEVRALVAAIGQKIQDFEVPMDSQGIGTALYGLHSMGTDQAQVRTLLKILAERIDKSDCNLNGQAISDSLYGLHAMSSDCVELRGLLKALSSRIDEKEGELMSQEIGNALFGLQGMSSEIEEVREIVRKLASKLQRSSATLRAQHIGRAMLGFKSLTADSAEIKLLLKEMTKRIKASDRIIMTPSSIANSLYGLQSMQSDSQEIQDLLNELAKKISSSPTMLSPREVGRALYGLQGLSTQASIFSDSAIGLDVDEVQFLLSVVWDKVKKLSGRTFPLRAIAEGMQGLTLLKDPIAENIRQFIYLSVIKLGEAIEANATLEGTELTEEQEKVQRDLKYTDLDVIMATRALKLNGLLVPKWLAVKYLEVEELHAKKPVIPASRADKLIVQRYNSQYPHDAGSMIPNHLIDGFNVDLCFENIKLVIELDSDNHSSPVMARYDRERDEYLLSKGYGVRKYSI